MLFSATHILKKRWLGITTGGVIYLWVGVTNMYKSYGILSFKNQWFLFTTHERRTTEETAADVKKNEELLDGEIEGFKCI